MPGCVLRYSVYVKPRHDLVNMNVPGTTIPENATNSMQDYNIVISVLTHDPSFLPFGRHLLSLKLLSSSIIAHHNRQCLKHYLILLIMTHEPTLQHPLQSLQARQLPPLVDPHDAALVYPDHHPRAVPTSRFIIDGVLIPGPTGRVFDRVEDVCEVCAEGFAVVFAEVMGADRGDGLEGVDQLVGAAVGGVEADELGDAGGFVGVGHDFAVWVVGQAVFFGVDLLEGFLEEEGDVFAGCDLDRGEGGGGLFGEGFDRVFGLGGHVVDQGAEEAPFFEGGGYRLRLVGRGDGVAIAGYDLEEEIHVFKDLVVGGAAVEGAGAKGVDGGCFAGGGGRVGDCAFERSGGGFVYQVGRGGHESHCECYGERLAL